MQTGQKMTVTCALKVSCAPLVGNVTTVTEATADCSSIFQITLCAIQRVTLANTTTLHQIQNATGVVTDAQSAVLVIKMTLQNRHAQMGSVANASAFSVVLTQHITFASG